MIFWYYIFPTFTASMYINFEYDSNFQKKTFLYTQLTARVIKVEKVHNKTPTFH